MKMNIIVSTLKQNKQLLIPAPSIFFACSPCTMDQSKKTRLASNIADYWLPPVVPRRRFQDVSSLELLETWFIYIYMRFSKF